MYSTRLLFNLTLCCGIIITSVGIYLKITDQISQGYHQYRRSGIDFTIETIDGNGTIVLGVLMLLFSIYNYRMYKKQREANANTRKLEDLQLVRKKHREIQKEKLKALKN